MNNVSGYLEQRMSAVAQQLSTMYHEVDDIVKAYFSTDATTLVAAAATDGTAVTVTSKLTKLKYINGITICQQLQNFFTNQAVAGPSDYMSLAQMLVNSSTAAGAVLSNDVEAIGDRLRALGINLIQFKKDAADMLSVYNSSQLAAALTEVDSGITVFGCSTTKGKLVDGMNLLQNLKNFLDNASVTTGDYLSIVGKWTQGA